MKQLYDIRPGHAARRPRPGRHAGRVAGPHRTAGFTLLELLVVLAILGLLAAFATPQVMGYLGRAKASSSGIQLQRLEAVLDLYRLDVGRYPSQDEGLQALLTKPSGVDRWRGPYLTSQDSVLDPWGSPYVYRVPGRDGATFDLYSLGADGAEGGDGENGDVWSR